MYTICSYKHYQGILPSHIIQIQTEVSQKGLPQYIHRQSIQISELRPQTKIPASASTPPTNLFTSIVQMCPTTTIHAAKTGSSPRLRTTEFHFTTFHNSASHYTPKDASKSKIKTHRRPDHRHLPSTGKPNYRT